MAKTLKTSYGSTRTRSRSKTNTRTSTKSHSKSNAYGLSHDDLVLMASKWLQRFCHIVITEMTTLSREECDAIGFSPNGTVLIECKASRSDFLSDKRKPFRREPWRGMGNLRLFMAPKGLVHTNELPPGWGLIECTAKRYKLMKKSQRFSDKNMRAEYALLISALRRVGQHAPDGVSVRPYTYTTRNRATLGVLVDE